MEIQSTRDKIIENIFNHDRLNKITRDPVEGRKSVRSQ